jgi:hypothetical protein
MQSSDPTAGPSRAASHAAEAARYALLRRLAPSMRHHLVVNLQPIGMIYEVMERRLRNAQPDLGHLQDSATKINGFARAALASCIDVVGWLAPDEGVRVAVPDAVRESAGMLATSLSFRGYALRNEVEAVAGEVRRSAIRTLLPAVLVHITDHLAPPAELAISAEAAARGALVHVAIRPGSGERGFAAEAGYRQLDWQDLQALAEAEGVELQRQEDRISILLPWSIAA